MSRYFRDTTLVPGIIIYEQEGKDMPYEGVNEKGLFVGIAAVPDTDTPFSLFKSMTTSLGMVKRALERASNVNEAIKLFQEHTLIFGTLLGNPVVHFKLVDRENNSAIIEYVNGEMVVIKDPIECQIMTNHFISLENSAQLSKTSFKRYESLRDELRKNFYSHIDVAQSLARVANDYETIGFYTVWSNVYDLTNLLIWTKYKNQEYKKTDIASVLRNANKESHLPIAEIK